MGGAQWCQGRVPSEQVGPPARILGLRIGMPLHCLTRAGGGKGGEGNITAQKRSWEQELFYEGIFLVFIFSLE
jgi:hypothetical protein